MSFKDIRIQEDGNLQGKNGRTAASHQNTDFASREKTFNWHSHSFPDYINSEAVIFTVKAGFSPMSVTVRLGGQSAHAPPVVLEEHSL